MYLHDKEHSYKINDYQGDCTYCKRGNNCFVYELVKTEEEKT